MRRTGPLWIATACLAAAPAPAAGALELGIQDDRLFLGPPITADSAPEVTAA